MIQWYNSMPNAYTLYNDIMIQRYNDTTVCLYNDIMIQRYNDTTVCLYNDILIHDTIYIKVQGITIATIGTRIQWHKILRFK